MSVMRPESAGVEERQREEAARGLGCWVEVDMDALAHNARAIRQYLGDEKIFYGVVKANAYGCGIVECARCLVENGVDRLAVTHVSEGVQLRQSGIDAPILVMAPFVAEEASELVRYDLTASVSAVEAALAIAREGRRQGRRKLPIHIKVETGLGRTGVFAEEAPSLVAAILGQDELYLEGAFTHLATAATGDVGHVHRQVARFREAVAAMEACAGAAIPVKHVANSAATMAFPQYHFDGVRVGTLLYGQPAGPVAAGLALRDVWRLKARVAHVATLPPGHGVGYGRAFVTGRETRVAVLPIGYVDGYQLEPVSMPVSLWDLAKVLLKTSAAYFGIGPLARSVRIGDRRAPVLGKVAMQMTMIDVTAIPDVQPGTVVQLPARRTVVALNVPRLHVSAETTRLSKLGGSQAAEWAAGS
ncbi:alanine racemase [Heliobacterium gestii]|uniref:Alanine racemase n=1 Tax=Heliomicrobium gestii TaxID=2699 RepID=A0A845LIB8_HELGE|nr:alanine racemase [Heliomicrobium gestii]MBM7866537.1 alanine racemase [Heliomicrobium gestii]MZP43183.1 alanine racemase [Heliomicrobium gestii]